MNGPVLDEVNRTLGNGEIGIGVLGGDHFSTGWVSDSTKGDSPHSIEALAEGLKVFQNTRIIVIETHDYATANQEFETSFSLQWENGKPLT
jgi:hypothetical protein